MRCVDCQLCKVVERPVYYKVSASVACGIQLRFYCKPHHSEVLNPFIKKTEKDWCSLYIPKERREEDGIQKSS